MERTLILVKPDAFARNLTGEIIARFERKGLRLVALQQMTMTRELAAAHYAEHEGKPFYDELVDVHHLGAAGRDGARGRAGGRRRPSGDRRDQPARGDHRARSAATSRSRSARTWSTAPTRRSRRPARWGCSSRTSPRDPRLALAAAARDPDRLGVTFEALPGDVEELEQGPPNEVAIENAYRKASAVAAGAPDAVVLGVDTIVALGGRIYGKPRDRAARAARRWRRSRDDSTR